MASFQAIQTEIDASFLYALLADQEENPAVEKIFREMSAIEYSHACVFAEKNNLNISALPGPSFRARMLRLIGRLFGYDYVLGVLMDTEKSIANSVRRARSKTNLPESINDTAHVHILKNILENGAKVSGQDMARFEKRHRSVGGNALRAAVLGGNDGLVSNFSLVMGVAGASVGRAEVLLTGVAGLMAGALSMALGEWISVKSSQELSENQMELEMEELENNPEAEERELALIYMAKGISEEEARRMAAAVMTAPEKAHAVLVQEELGINPEELKGSAMEAALTSFVMFAFGAIVPVLPFIFLERPTALWVCALVSALGLFLIGASITLFTGRSIWASGMRQVVFGLAAAAITFGIGRLIGVSIGG
jgi:VIT1/CCC1 family predicted Fe2+/Mn2+ transporter